MEKYIPVVVIKELSETDKILSALKADGIHCCPKLHSERRVRLREAIEYACRKYPRNVDRRGYGY